MPHQSNHLHDGSTPSPTPEHLASSQLFNPATQSYILGAGHADFKAHNKQLDMQAQANLNMQAQQQLMAYSCATVGQQLSSAMTLYHNGDENYWFGYPPSGTSPYSGYYPPDIAMLGSAMWPWTSEAGVGAGLEQYQSQEYPFMFGESNDDHDDSQGDDDTSDSSSQMPSPTPLVPKRAITVSPITAGPVAKRRRDSLDRPINPSAPVFVPGRYKASNYEWSKGEAVHVVHHVEAYSHKLERWLDMDDDEFVYVITPVTGDAYQAIVDAQAASWKRFARRAGLTVEHPSSAKPKATSGSESQCGKQCNLP